MQTRVVFLKLSDIDTVKEQFAAEVFIESRWREKSLDHGKVKHSWLTWCSLTYFYLNYSFIYIYTCTTIYMNMYVFLSLCNNIPVLLISYRRTTIWNFLNIGPLNLSFKTSSHLRKTMSGRSWNLVRMGRHLLWRRGESKEYLQKTWSSMTSHLIFRYSCISYIPFHSL